MTQITQNIGSFSLAFGAENGIEFCAILWPEQHGQMPYVQAPNLRLHLDGFVLFDHDKKNVLGFFGVDAESRSKLESHHIVILVPSNDGYKQTEVIGHQASPRIILT